MSTILCQELEGFEASFVSLSIALLVSLIFALIALVVDFSLFPLFEDKSLSGITMEFFTFSRVLCFFDVVGVLFYRNLVIFQFL